MQYITSEGYRIAGFDYYCDVAKNIKKLREESGYTQKKLSAVSKVPAGRISDLEGVKTRPELQELKKLADALKVSVDRIILANYDLHGEEGMYLVWMTSARKFKLYIRATSGEMACFRMLDRLRSVCRIEPTDRCCYRLVGRPVKDVDLLKEFRKRDPREKHDELSPDEPAAERRG